MDGGGIGGCVGAFFFLLRSRGGDERDMLREKRE